MAVTRTIEQNATEVSNRAARAARQPAAVWASPSQVRKASPMVRLLAEIWAIPQVKKIGVVADEEGIQVRVLVAEDDRDARARVYAAERGYLNTTSPHGFNLRVSPASKAGMELPAPFETILER